MSSSLTTNECFFSCVKNIFLRFTAERCLDGGKQMKQKKKDSSIYALNAEARNLGMSYGQYVMKTELPKENSVSETIKTKKENADYHCKLAPTWKVIKEVVTQFGCLVNSKETIFTALRSGYCIFACDEIEDKFILKNVYELKGKYLYQHNTYKEYPRKRICIYRENPNEVKQWVDKVFKRYDVLVVDSDRMFDRKNPSESIDTCQMLIQKAFNNIETN